jgi:hypothetical protein
VRHQQSSRHSIQEFLLHVFLPLIVGGMIYLSFREKSLLMFHWTKWAGQLHFINASRSALSNIESFVPLWVIYSLPDALWVYAITAFMVLMWRNTSGPWKVFWIALGPILGVGAELGQSLRIVSGTFDFSDLLLCSSAALAAIILVPVKINVQTKEVSNAQ